MKRQIISRILLLIFCLLLFFPTQKTYSEDWGDISGEGFEIIFAPLLVPALIFAVAYDLATDRCVLHWHPGDYYYEKNYKIIKPINIKVQKCYIRCTKKSVDKHVAMGSVRSNKKDDSGNFSECYNPCFKEAIKPFPTTLATCAFKESDDYYTDGSYYTPSTNNPSLQKIFTNKHKLRNKYEKTDWQQARDKCMELTWKKNHKTYFKSIRNRNIMMIDFYNDCLKERGY